MITIKDIKNNQEIEIRELDYIPSTGEVISLNYEFKNIKIRGIVQSVEHIIKETPIRTEQDLIINVY